MTSPQPPKWAEQDLDVVKECLRQAELQLASQAQTTDSHEKRATSLAGFANAGLAATVAFVGPRALTGELSWPASAAALAMIAALIVSAVLSFVTLLPSEWHSPGTWPHQWYGLLSQKRYKPVELLGATLVQLDRACAQNQRRNESAAKRLKAAVIAGMAAVPLAILTHLVAWAATRAW